MASAASRGMIAGINRSQKRDARFAKIEAARTRRVGRAVAKQAEIKWFVQDVLKTTRVGMRKRVSLATHYLASRVVQNISVPVERGAGGIVTRRSKPGQYPRAETTQLMKTIFTAFNKIGEDIYEGYVATPLDYGLILEVKINRSFLLKTMIKERRMLKKILGQKIQPSLTIPFMTM